MDQSLRSAIRSMTLRNGLHTGSSGRTCLFAESPCARPSTPLIHEVFTAGFDATTTSNLGASFGQTKVRLEVRSASLEQYKGDFNTEKEWHQCMPTPWDVRQLSPAQALTISCQSCGVQIASDDLRDTYGRSFVVKSLDKVKRDCCNLFPQDNKRINLPRLASIFEEPGFCHADAPQHQFGAHREHCPAHQWLECENPKRIPNYKQPLVVRNASQGVGFHRVERLRKQKHSSTALSLSALFHTGKHEKQAVHQLLFGLHMQCIMSVFFRLFRLKGGSGINVKRILTISISNIVVHFQTLNSMLNSTSSSQTFTKKYLAASRQKCKTQLFTKNVVCC